MPSAHRLFETRVKVHGATEIGLSKDLPVTFRTVPEPWDAISLPRTEASPSASIVVRVRAIVEEGSITIGLMHHSGSGFVNQLQLDATNGQPVSVELVAVDPAECGELMIRNASSFGASRGTLLGVEYLESGESPDEVRRPSLSEPFVFPRWGRHYGNLGLDTATMLRAGAFDRFDSPHVMRWHDGLALRLAPGDRSCRALYLSGTYEPNTLRILRAVLDPGNVFIDVGANAGIISLPASRWVGPQGHVYAFEPSSREFARLTDAIELNQASQIHPIRAAAAASAGTVPLRVAESDHGGLNTLGSDFAYAGVDVAGLEQVPAIALDEFAEQEQLARVDAIKIDVEGAEGEVLTGARQLLARYRPSLVIELFGRALSTTGWTVARLERLLVDSGYALFQIDDESGRLMALVSLSQVDEQNIVALPRERSDSIVARTDPW